MTMTAKGEIERGTIVIRDGRIAAIGPDIAVPAGARVMDGRGGTVTPALIQADSTLGAVEVSQVPASPDRATHSATISACFDISLVLHPHSLLLMVSRMGGFTPAVAPPGFPHGSLRPIPLPCHAALPRPTP